MFRTLYAKLVLVLALLLIVIGVVYAVVSLSVTQRHLDSINQTLNRDLAKTLVANRNLIRAGDIDEEALKQIFHDYMQINPSIEIYLLDHQGSILSYSADPRKVIRDRVSLEPIRRFLSSDVVPVLGDDPRSRDRRKAFSVTQIRSGSDIEGYLYVVLRGEAFDVVAQALEESYFVRLSLYAVGISLLVALITGLLVFWRMTRRLRRLSDAMERFRRLDFAPQVLEMLPATDLSEDEIDQLGQTFSLMSAKIVDQIDMLKTKDLQRRDMIANISHDLRTPLASMNGYLETLNLKAESLSETERQECLEVALRYGRQLAKLVDDLFELAKLEAVDQKINREPCSISDLTQDVLQKLRLEADARGVAITANVPQDLPLAHADIGLIERVLENIIVNAIEHTPSGTEVAIDVFEQDDEITVSITDTGEGIPKQDIPHLFERFYQGQGSHRQGSHAGLGLAIAKQILELHDRAIAVTSQLGQGTTFSFNLPEWKPG